MLKDELFSEHEKLLKLTAMALIQKFPPHFFELDELISIGYMALKKLENSGKLSKANVSYKANCIKWAVHNASRTRKTIWHSKTDHKTYLAMLSLDELQCFDGNTVDTIGDDGIPEEEVQITLEQRQKIKQAVSDLSDRERFVILQRYIADRQVQGIAKDIGVSQSRASRIVSSAVQKIRSQLEVTGY